MNSYNQYQLSTWTPALTRVIRMAEVFANQDNLHVGIEHVLEAIKVQKGRSSGKRTAAEVNAQQSGEVN